MPDSSPLHNKYRPETGLTFPKDRILFVIPNLLRGGAEYQLLELCKSLKRNGFDEFHVLVFYRNLDGAATGYEQEFLQNGISTTVLFEQVPGKLALLRALLRQINALRPDVAQSFLEANEYLLIIRLFARFRLYFGIRTHYTVPPVNRLLIRWLRPLVTAFVGNARRSVLHFARQVGAPDEQAICIYNGIDTRRFQVNVDRNQLRLDLGISASSRVFITVANMHMAIKGHACLLDAWRDHAQRFPTDHLLLVGEGRLRAELEMFVKTSALGDSVHFLGSRTDVPGLLKLSDVYVSPSLTEGFSNSIAEALLNGLPVIATEAGGSRELVNSEAKGVVVPVNDPRALAAAMANTYSPLPASEVDTVRRQTDLDRLGREYLQLYGLPS